MCNSPLMRDFLIQLRVLTLFLGGATTFLVFSALAADGYFTDHPRYVYENFTLGADGLKNSSAFETLDTELNSTQATIDGVTHFYNLTRVIPIGSLSNSSGLFFVAPNVPGLAVLLVGAFGVAQIVFTIREIVSNCHVVGGSAAVAIRIIWFTYGQGLLQLLLQYLFYALVAFYPTIALWKAFYVMFAMVCVLVLKNFYPLAHKCCGNRGAITEIEMALLMPHAILSFFAIIQVPIIIAKLGGTHDPSWAVAFVPVWMVVLVNTGGWIAFICTFLRQISNDPGPFGLLLSSGLVYLLYNCSVASSLILLCVNDNPDYFGQSEWPYPWWRVVLPVLVAYAVLLLLHVGQLVYIVVHAIQQACRRCEIFSQKQQKEADEHVRRAAVGAADPGGAADTANVALVDSASVELAAAGFDHSARQADLTFVSTLARQLSQGRHDRVTEQMLLEQLRSLQQLLTTHPALVTPSNRLLILQRFENYHNKCDEAEWSELVASRYARLLRTFTKANVILNMFPSLKNMRNLDMTRKPPLPVE